MKINEQLELMFPHTPKKNLHDMLDFEQLINTPTKQNSGDEYYWQHQDQLQQSSLQFNPQPIANQSKKTKVLEKETIMYNPEGHLQITNSPIRQNRYPFQYEKQNNTVLNTKVSQIFRELEPKLNPILMSVETPETSQKTDELDQFKEINAIDSLPYNPNEFKNHHLFIHNKQVELTLNIQNLAPDEQKEFTSMMRNHLKNKGLTLSKLIINGVEND
ncbi:hypothetical protein [Legionella maioricensis]|uniref:Uncharacterized protein n=1 Tax=Legionella maioricensis TaxID=2896528 RepID=A0A9X2CXM3_9GAMM|nr:hypothetical protein [Legionella maioricensis]MCL9682637.1 hypothetical protein [Legionella maioricensis]MCL9687316.1 hypothetical protein [Legionella maioricensis]